MIFVSDLEVTFWRKKPERVFGLQVRCRELDIFKILEMFWIFWGEFFSRIFWRYFVGFFWEDFLGGFFGEEFFGRNSLVDFYKELMLLSRFWGNFVSMEGRRKEGRKEEGRKEDFRSLEV